MSEEDQLFKNMRSVIMIVSSKGPCTSEKVEKKYNDTFGESTEDLMKCGFNSFRDVLSEMIRQKMVKEQGNLLSLTNINGMTTAARNIQSSLSNSKASSYKKLGSLAGRESQIKSYRTPGPQGGNFNPKRQVTPAAQPVEAYVQKRQTESRFTAPTIHRSVPPPPSNFAPVPPHLNYPEIPSLNGPNTNLTNVNMGPPPGLAAVAGIKFIYEKRMIAMLKECFPYGLSLIDVVEKIDVSSISPQLSHREIKDVLIHSEHVFYEPSEEIYYGRPTIGDDELSNDLIQKFVYEILAELKRSVSLDELSGRLNVMSSSYNDPRMKIFEALIESSVIDYEGIRPDVLYFIRPPQEPTKTISYASVSKALEKMDFADENAGPPVIDILKDWTDALITDFRDFTCFSVRFASKERCFQQMREELSKYCESMTSFNCVHLRVGDAVAVKNDGEWLRAEVLYGGDAKMILLRSIDVGYCFYEYLPSRNVMFLPKQFRIEAFAYYCSLYDIDECDEEELTYYADLVRTDVDVSILSISQLAERAHSVKLLLPREKKLLPDDFFSYVCKN